MSQSRIDRFLGAAVILLGILQVLSTFHFFTEVEEAAAWFLAGGLFLATSGSLTLLRIRYGDVAPGVRSVAIITSVVLAIFYIALYWVLLDKFLRTPPSFTGLFVVVAAAVVALFDRQRTRSPHS